MTPITPIGQVTLYKSRPGVISSESVVIPSGSFDAATSSFGDSKEEDFYNVIDNVNKQCIIVTKDFITKGKVRYSEIEKLTCSVYRIKKAEGFDLKNLATIRTTIENIK